MKNLTHTFLGLFFTALIASSLIACGDSEKEKALADKDKELEELRQLAEMDRREMENQYAEFAAQYGEMQKTIKDDSLVARLDAEKRRAENLLKELREMKKTSTSEILRLRKELETVRAVLRDYIRQVDSLQQLNQSLVSERDDALAAAERTRNENASINERNTELSEKVAIAAQLNATGVSISANKKNGKAAKRSKDIKQFAVSFTITRNVTASAGNRTFYVRLLKPGNAVVNSTGTFSYENKSIDYSASKVVEYTGEEQRVTLYITADNEMLSGGTYSAYIFADGQMIGSGSMSMKK